MLTTAEIATIINRIEGLLKRSEFAVVDALLNDQDVKKIEDLVVPLTWLRISYPFRSRFFHWHSLRCRLADEIDARGGDSRRTMRGLYMYSNPIQDPNILGGKEANDSHDHEDVPC